MRDQFHWARILSFVTGLVNQELLLRNEYLAAENRILRAHLPARLRLSDAERSTLAEIAKRLGRKALREIAPRVQAGYPSRLVPATGGTQVRRLWPPRPSWPTQDIARNIEAGSANGAREPGLGI
jgi:hypothetical protein